MALIVSENLPMEAAGPLSPPRQIHLSQDDLKKIATYKAVDLFNPAWFSASARAPPPNTPSTVSPISSNKANYKTSSAYPLQKKTHLQALSLGIPLPDLDSHRTVDLAIDGADEVDGDLNLAKGRGGSLLREKMIESTCKKFVVIFDETKLVSRIGENGAVPVEIVPFCWKFTQERLRNLFDYAGCVAKLRTIGGEIGDGDPFVTDNGNYIVDLFFEKEIGDLREASDAILRLAGVVEHGMFLGMATTVIVARELGVTIKNQ